MFSFARYEGIVVGILLLISIANVGIRAYVHNHLPEVSVLSPGHVAAASDRVNDAAGNAGSEKEMDEVTGEGNGGEEPEASPQVGIDLNLASLEELVTLPGIGPTLAMRIIAHRTEVGPFTDVHDLLLVSGIGQKRLESLLPFVKVGAVGE